jgi:hypothetical protein
METTRRFERLPPDAGVPFTGFEFAHIASRKPVAKQLREQVKYCTRFADAPAMCVVLGEWGEGKTEAFQRYIEPVANNQGHFAYLIRASTVARSLTRVEAGSPRTSVDFLAAVFYAIQHETRSDLIPPWVRQSSVEEWLLTVLQNHDRKKGRILVFIDEFEELILEPDALKRILSGLKETINKQFTEISEAGPYPGIISFFVSCTPDAYARMQREQDIAEIFGSWERRAKKIELRPVTRAEGVKFLYDLMRFAYSDELPSPLPIKSLGIFHTLQIIGRGNLGALVTLFTRLLNEALTDNDELHVIDGDVLLASLAGESIAIYGGSASCVDRQVLANVEQILAGLSEEARQLFRLLAGELRPFSTSELAERLGLTGPADVSQLIGRINSRLEERQGAKAITRLVACQPSITIEDIRTTLRRIIHDDRIRLDGTERSLAEFEDELTYLRFEDGEPVASFFLPPDASLADTSLEATKKLLNWLETLIDETVPYYRLSEDLAFRLFPTPVPVGLEYIRDRDLRLNLWRNVTARFPEQFRDLMPRALLELINNATPFEIRVANVNPLPMGMEATIEYSAQNAKIKARCYAHYGDIGPIQIRELERELEKAWPVHLFLLVHVGDLSESARTEIQGDRLRNHLLHLPLHTTLTKHLLIAHQCSTRHRDRIDKGQFTDTVTDLLRTQVELDNRVRAWLKEGTANGLVIQDLHKDATGRDAELAEALRFYVNVLDRREPPTEVLELDEQPERFRVYDTKVSFAPDVATSADRFSKLTQDLKNNGFVMVDPLQGNVTVTETPVEQRLLGLLKQGEIAASKVNDYFVIAARSSRILTDVYLNILQYKGRVQETRGLLTLVDREEAVNAARESYDSYQKSLEAWRDSPDWSAFAHIYVTKRQPPRKLIVLDELDDYLASLHVAMHSATRDEIALQRAKLMIELIDYFQRALLPLVEKAIKRGRELRSGFLQRVTEVNDKLRLVVEKYNANLTADQVEEFSELTELEQSVSLLAITALSREKLETIAQTVDPTEFFFRRGSQGDSGFPAEADSSLNLTLHRLQQTIREQTQRVDSIDKRITTIDDLLDKIREASEETVSRLRTRQIDEKLIVSKVLYQKIEQDVRAWQQLGLEEVGAEPIQLSLDAIERHLQGIVQTLEPEFKEIDRAIDALDWLRKVEGNYWDKWKGCMHQMYLKRQVDISPYQERLCELEEETTHIQQDHQQLVSELESHLEKKGLEGSQTGEEARTHVEENIQGLNNICQQLSGLWPDYIADCQRFVKTIERLLHLISEQDPSVSTEAVKRDLDSLMQVEQIDSLQASRPMSTFENLRGRIRQATLELMEQSLSSEEGSVLISVVEKIQEEEADWLPLEAIAETVCVDSTWTPESVREVLYSLIRKGYLSEGVTIPV